MVKSSESFSPEREARVTEMCYEIWVAAADKKHSLFNNQHEIVQLLAELAEAVDGDDDDDCISSERLLPKATS